VLWVVCVLYVIIKGMFGKGKALLFLIPEELKYLLVLQKHKIEPKEYEFPVKKIANIQSQLEHLTNNVYSLHVLAHQVYYAYMRAYGMRSHNVFNVSALNIIHISKLFFLFILFYIYMCCVYYA